jgi:hypothetical protein
VAEVARQHEHADPVVLRRQLAENLTGVVAAAVVDEDELVVVAVGEGVGDPPHRVVQQRQAERVVVDRKDVGDGFAHKHLSVYSSPSR